MNITVSDIIAILAFILAAYSTKKTFDFNNKQKEFIETNDKLNRLLIEKEKEELLAKKSADLSANFINIGSTNYRLKIFNRGQGVARNVRIEVIEGNDLVIKSEFDSIFPIESLDRYQSVELIAPVHSQSSSKAKIKLIWDDDSGKDKFNTVTPIV